jgi:hypothetical protein
VLLSSFEFLTKEAEAVPRPRSADRLTAMAG